MSERFREHNGEEYLTTGQVLAYAGYKSDHWLYARVADGRLTRIPIDGKIYYSRKELDALLTPQVAEQHPRHDSERDFMTIEQVAHSVQLSYSYISRLIRERKIKAVNLSGKKGRGAVIRIHRDDYMRWVEERWLEQQQQEKEKVGAR